MQTLDPVLSTTSSIMFSTLNGGDANGNSSQGQVEQQVQQPFSSFLPEPISSTPISAAPSMTNPNTAMMMEAMSTPMNSVQQQPQQVGHNVMINISNSLTSQQGQVQPQQAVQTISTDNTTTTNSICASTIPQQQQIIINPPLVLNQQTMNVNTIPQLNSINVNDVNVQNIFQTTLPITQVAQIGTTTASTALPNITTLLPHPHSTTPHHPIAEFLYQLTKMLTDDNKHYIEWSNGRICVHDPQKLADTVLHKYFRHSKYASFQRQLNYFGFRKIAGKGKMSPCSYVNDAATEDLRSLLFIKRKTNGSAARNKQGNSNASPDTKGNAAVPEDVKSNESTGGTSPTLNGQKRKQEVDSPLQQPQQQQQVEPAQKRQQTLSPNCVLNPVMSSASTTMTTMQLPPTSLSSQSTTNPLVMTNTQLQQQLPQTLPSSTSQVQQLQVQQTSTPTVQFNVPEPSTSKKFNEQFHFPSEHTMAMLTCPQTTTSTTKSTESTTTTTTSVVPSYNNNSTIINIASSNNSVPSGCSSEISSQTSSSNPATEAMNEFINSDLSNTQTDDNSNVDPEEALLGFLQSSNTSMDPPADPIENNNATAAANAALNNNSMMNSLPSWDTLFPDSTTTTTQKSSITAPSSSTTLPTNTSSAQLAGAMLSRDSSLIDLAMLPSGSMLDMFRLAQNLRNSKKGTVTTPSSTTASSTQGVNNGDMGVDVSSKETGELNCIG